MLPIFGIFLRFEIRGGGVLLTDGALLGLSIFWVYTKSRTLKDAKHLSFSDTHSIFWAILAFWILAIFSLLKSSAYFSFWEIAESAFYLFRFILLSLLLRITFDIFQSLPKKERKKGELFMLYSFFGAATILAILGFFQLLVFPSFQSLNMEEFGWDPHIGRLLSTWFDPNFLAGFFAFTLSVLGGLILNVSHKKERIFYCVIALILIIALFLTYSRSGLLAFCISGGVMGILFSRKLLLSLLLLFFVTFPLSDRVQERAIDGIYSLKSLMSSEDALFLPDATARLRVESWENAEILFWEKPFFGHGFNTLRKVQLERGMLPEGEHSLGGVDSSLLTILVTTGMFGLFAFSLIFLFLLLQAFHKSFSKETISEHEKGCAQGFFCGLCGLFVHALFVNSLLFPWIMIYVFGLGGMLFVKENKKWKVQKN